MSLQSTYQYGSRIWIKDNLSAPPVLDTVVTPASHQRVVLDRIIIQHAVSSDALYSVSILAGDEYLLTFNIRNVTGLIDLDELLMPVGNYGDPLKVEWDSPSDATTIIIYYHLESNSSVP